MYREGSCHVLAIASPHRFGWPIYLVLDQAGRYREDPDDSDDWIPAVVHAYARVLHGWDRCRKGASLFFDAPDLAFMPHKYNAATTFRGRSDA